MLSYLEVKEKGRIRGVGDFQQLGRNSPSLCVGVKTTFKKNGGPHLSENKGQVRGPHKAEGRSAGVL